MPKVGDVKTGVEAVKLVVDIGLAIGEFFRKKKDQKEKEEREKKDKATEDRIKALEDEIKKLKQ